jgi:tetratricopeptide (TPR) repeat protein
VLDGVEQLERPRQAGGVVLGDQRHGFGTLPLAAALLLALAWGGWSAWKRRPDPETQRQRAEAMALIAQDDASSLARALELLDAIQHGAHASRGADGERGLARAMVAAAQADEVDPLAERLAAATVEKARLEREQPLGSEDAQRALAMEMTRLEVSLAPKRQKLEALRSRALQELRALAAQPRGGLEAARGLAVLAVLDSNGEEVQRSLELLRAVGPDDWADLVELWLAARQEAPARDQAIARLVALCGTHPELMRARFVLAQALQSAGRREEALSAVGRLLAANPRHERGQRLRSQLAVPPPLQPAPAQPLPPPRPVTLPSPRPPPQPPPAATNVVAPVLAPPPAAAVNQPVTPAPVPEMLVPPLLHPKPKPKTPEPSSAPDQPPG